MGEVAYELALALDLPGVHSMFHVYMLIKYYGDHIYIVRWDSVLFDGICLMNMLKEIAFVKVLWSRPFERLN